MERIGWFEERGWNCPLAVVAQPLWDQGTAPFVGTQGRDVHGQGCLRKGCSWEKNVHGKKYPMKWCPWEGISVGRNVSRKGFLCERMTLRRDVHRKDWPWEEMLLGKDAPRTGHLWGLAELGWPCTSHHSPSPVPREVSHVQDPQTRRGSHCSRTPGPGTW